MSLTNRVQGGLPTSGHCGSSKKKRFSLSLRNYIEGKPGEFDSEERGMVENCCLWVRGREGESRYVVWEFRYRGISGIGWSFAYAKCRRMHMRNAENCICKMRKNAYAKC